MSASGFVQTELQQIVRAAKERFAMDLQGIHGISHWQRVRENGLRIAKQSGANPLIVAALNLCQEARAVLCLLVANSQNRRRNPRRLPRGNAEITCYAYSTIPCKVISFFNVSTDGIGLILENALEPCDDVLLKISRFSHNPLAILGRVTRCDPSPGGGHFVGVQFVKPLTFSELARIS